MELAVLFGSFVILLALGVPVAFCLGLSALATLFYLDIPLVVAFQRMAAGIDVFALLAIPFFIYAGELMNQSGIAAKLVRFAESLLGRVRGGLGQVSVLSCMMFGAVSGSAVAGVSAMGSVLTPIMREKGYDDDFAVNVTATSSATGLLIPPSHNMIIYSIAAGGSVSIVSLFLAGILPGILLGLALMAVTWLIAVRRGYPGGAFPGWRQLLVAFVHAVPGLLSAIIIVGGILSGVFTATESSAIAVVYTVVGRGVRLSQSELAEVHESYPQCRQDHGHSDADHFRGLGLWLAHGGRGSSFTYVGSPAQHQREPARAVADHQSDPVDSGHLHGHGAAHYHHYPDLLAGRDPAWHGPGAIRRGVDIESGYRPGHAARGGGSVRRLRGRRHSDREMPAFHLALLLRDDLCAVVGDRSSFNLACAAWPVRIGSGPRESLAGVARRNTVQLQGAIQ